MAKSIDKRSTPVGRGGEITSEAIIEKLNEAAVGVNPHNEILFINPAAEKMLGFSSNDLYNQPLTVVLPGFDSASKIAGLMDIEARRKNGSVFSARASYTHFDSGSLPYGIVILREVTSISTVDFEGWNTRAKLQAALDSMTDAVVISDTAGNFIDFNEAFATFHKFESKAQCAKTLSDLPVFLEVYMESGEPAPLDLWAVPRALSGEVGVNIEYSLKRKDTGESWIGSYSFSPVRDENGKIVGAVVVGRDITDQKKAELKIREEQEKFRSVFESANVGKSMTSEAGILSVNQAFADMLGYERAELNNRHWREITPPEDIPMVEDIFKRLQSGEMDSARTERRYLRKDGTPIWADMNITAYRDSYGRFQYFINTFVEISKQKQIMHELNESEERFRAIVENSPDGFFIELDRKFAYLNPSACRIYGINSPDQLLGTPVLESVHPDYRDKAVQRIRQLDETRQSVKDLFEVRFLRLDGDEVWVETSGEPIQIDGKNGSLVVVRDISKRKEIERSREEIEARFRLLAESAPIGIVITDQEHNIIYVSPRFVEIFGYTLEEIPTVEAWYKLAYPDPQYRAEVVNLWRGAIRKAAETGAEIKPHVFQVKRKDGENRQVEFRMKTAEGLNFVVLTDVTARALAESETKRQREILQLFIEHAPAAIAMFDREMRYIAVSHRFLLDYEIPEQDLIGKKHYDVFPELPEVVKDIHRRCLAGAVESSPEDEFLRSSGKIDYLRWEMMPWFEREGEIGGVILFSEVITQRKLAEKAAEKFIQRLKNLHAIDQAILQARPDPEETVTSAIQTLTGFIGCRHAAVGILDRKALEIQVIDINPPSNDFRSYRRTIQNETLKKMEAASLKGSHFVKPNDETPITFLLKSILDIPPDEAALRIPLKADEGLVGFLYLGWPEQRTITLEEIEIADEVSQQIAIVLHQSNLRRQLAAHAADLEARVIERTAQLETANRDLEAFAYSVSHDLRAPLRGIHGFSEILEEELGQSLNDEGRRILGVITSNTRKMDRLITDLLELSRTSRTELKLEAVDMNAIAREVFDEVVGDAVKPDFRLDDLPGAQADPILIRQVWSNLISNAFKFSRSKPDCRIEISGERLGDECIFTVRDNGVGFDEAYIKNIFEVFKRLHKESEFEGTGVGLAIVQRIVQRHGGRVWAEGKTGEGAAFHFSLPGAEKIED
jgi:PAS domain S-box-containing protein